LVYRIITETTAQKDALEYAAFIISESQATAPAEKWLAELERAIDQLTEMPRRFKVIDEQLHFLVELRQFIHHSHRVIFHVNDETKTVHILRVYHCRRDALNNGALEGDSS
jgi:plasmid stabilization system protein ParE